MLQRTRVLIADDHQMLADALKRLLEPRFEVVGIVCNGRALVETAQKLRPDVVVVDVAMPQLNGLDAARQIKHRTPNVKIVFMTMNEDPDLVGEAFRAGVSASYEAGRGIQIDGCHRQSAKRWFVRDTQGGGGPGAHFAAGSQGS